MKATIGTALLVLGALITFSCDKETTGLGQEPAGGQEQPTPGTDGPVDGDDSGNDPVSDPTADWQLSFFSESIIHEPDASGVNYENYFTQVYYMTGVPDSTCFYGLFAEVTDFESVVYQSTGRQIKGDAAVEYFYKDMGELYREALVDLEGDLSPLYADNMLYRGDPCRMEFYYMEPGAYPFYVFQFDMDLRPTGHWKRMEVEVPEAEPTTVFSKWLGTWNLSFGEGDISRSFDLTFASRINNHDILISGFQDQMEQYAVLGRLTADNELYVFSHDWYPFLFTGLVDVDGQQLLISNAGDETPLAVMRMADDGNSIEVTGADCTVNGQDYPFLCFSYCRFAGVKDQYDMIDYTTGFPFTLTRK